MLHRFATHAHKDLSHLGIKIPHPGKLNLRVVWFPLKYPDQVEDESRLNPPALVGWDYAHQYSPCPGHGLFSFQVEKLQHGRQI